MATGAAVSDFGYERAARHERLLSELVYEVLGEEPGVDEHEAALDHCLHATKHHRFADTEPKQIERLFAQLGDRMVSQAQYTKQRALESLLTALICTDLGSDTLEVNHRILSLLYYASNSPLNAYYKPGPVVQGLQQPEWDQEEGDALDHILPELREKNSMDADDLEGPMSSDLSEWSDSEESQAVAPALGQATEPLTDAPDERASPMEARRPFFTQSTYAKPPEFGIGKGHVPEYSQGCLFLQLAESRCKGVPFALPSATKCTTQPSLASQIIGMMRGCRDPGPAFQWDSETGRFEVAEGVHVMHMSPSLLRNLLQHFAEAGNMAARLWGVVSGTQHGCFQGKDTSPSPSWVAFAAAVGGELQCMAEHLIAVEHQTERDLQLGNLLHLRAALQGPAHQLRLLWIALEAVAEAQEAPSACERSAHLLSALHQLLLEVSHQASPQGHEEAACVIKLLTRALGPCLEALDLWLEHAALPTSHGEFFIQQDASVGEESEDFWEKAYTLKKAADGRSLCPDFLESLAIDILDSGKSLILLRGQPQQHSRSSNVQSQVNESGVDQVHEGIGGAKIRPNGLPSRSLHGHYLTSLRRLLQGTGSCDGSRAKAMGERQPVFLEAPEASISKRMAEASAWRLASHPTLTLLQPLEEQTAMFDWRQPPPCGDRPSVSGLGQPSSAGMETPAATKALLSRSEVALGSAERLSSNQGVDMDLAQAKQEGVEAAWLDDPGMRGWVHRLDCVMASPSSALQSLLSKPAPLDTSLRPSPLTTPLQVSGVASGRFWISAASYAKQDEDASDDQAWLDGIHAADLPPSDVLLQRCLLGPIQSRVSITGAQLLSELMGRWELRKQLAALRNLYLGGAPILLPFMHDLIHRLLTGEQLTAMPITSLQASLEDCLSSTQLKEQIPDGSSLTVAVNVETHEKILDSLKAAEVRRRAKEASAVGRQTVEEDIPRTLVEIKALTLDCKMPWPLALVVDKDSLAIYNAVFAFLLQLKWAKELVRTGQRQGGRGQAFSAAHPFGQRLLHLVDSLEHFVTYSLASAWQTLQQDLDGAKSMQDVQNAHRHFLKAASQPCMASSDGSWAVIYNVLRRLLDMCLEFHQLAPSLQEASLHEQASRRLVGMQSVFADRHRYLLKSLSAKSLKIEDKSGLQYLVMRLNFNNFYHY